MKCLVPVKQVIDPYVNIRIKTDRSGVEKDHVKMAMNPFDEIAMEEAVRLKEKEQLSEVIAITIGQNSCQEVLRQALARGADQAIFITTERFVSPLMIAKILQSIIETRGIEFVLMGKQAIDDDNNQTGQILAGLLGWSQGTFVSTVNLELETQTVQVVREIDGGLESVRLKFPAVITTDLRLNEPRYISLPNVMKAKKKPIETISLDALNLNLIEKLKVLSVMQPPAKSPGIKVNSVTELVKKLRDEEKVIP